MNRLTEKNSIVPRSMMNAEYAKLADLEDIEEELGIDLITLFKALKNGIHTIDNKYICGYDSNVSFGWLDIDDECLVFNVVRRGEYQMPRRFWFKDYGKTWALTKEELEDDR